MLDPNTAHDQYQPRPGKDATHAVYHARLSACLHCRLRHGHECRIANQLCSILARPAGGSCPNGQWPREVPPTRNIAPPAAAPHPEISSPVGTVSEAPPAAIENLAVVTSFFNPQGYRRPLANYHRFAAGIAETGLPLWTIELAFDEDSFQIAETDRTFHLRGSRDRHLMFQKERLLNLLIERLPADVDAVAWIDADVLFLNRNWVDETLAVLSRRHVCQPHARAFDLRPDGELIQHSLSSGALWSTNPRAHNDYRLSHPGFAWAARAAWLRKFGLFDQMITGAGDLVIVEGLTGVQGVGEGMGRPLSEGWTRSVADWSGRVHADVAGSLGHVPGSILHLYHGSNPNRRYGDRWKLLIDYQFDPTVDLILEGSGLWAWSDRALTEKPGLIAAVADCFASRREDD